MAQQLNLVQALPYFCQEVQKKNRAAGEFLLKNLGFTPDVIAAVSACCNDDGKVIKVDGSKMGMSDMMNFKLCI